MNADRRVRLWHLVAERAEGGPPELRHICAEVISAASVSGVAVAVTLTASPRETLFASDALAARLEEATLTLGEGPGVDAFTGSLALAPDITEHEYQVRWPAFAAAAFDAGVRAVFALPLPGRCGTPGRDGPLPRRAGRSRRGLPGRRAGPGRHRVRAAPRHDRRRWPRHGRMVAGAAGPQHPEIHQATGMLIVQLGVSAAVALVRLRAHAYSHDRRLRDVANDVVARRLRFEPEGRRMTR